MLKVLTDNSKLANWIFLLWLFYCVYSCFVYMLFCFGGFGVHDVVLFFVLGAIGVPLSKLISVATAIQTRSLRFIFKTLAATLFILPKSGLFHKFQGLINCACGRLGTTEPLCFALEKVNSFLSRIIPLLYVSILMLAGEVKRGGK